MNNRQCCIKKCLTHLYSHFCVLLIILLVGVFAAEAKSGTEYSEVDEAAEAKEMEEASPEAGSNGDLESKQENVEDGNNSKKTFSYDQLKNTSRKNISGIDLNRREVSLALNHYKHLKMGQTLQVPPMNFPTPLILLNPLYNSILFWGLFVISNFSFVLCLYDVTCLLNLCFLLVRPICQTKNSKLYLEW